MPKFYVSDDGKFNYVISRADIENCRQAVTEILQAKLGEKGSIKSFIRVSEKGFDKHKTDVILDSEEMMREAGFQFEDDPNDDSDFQDPRKG